MLTNLVISTYKKGRTHVLPLNIGPTIKWIEPIDQQAQGRVLRIFIV